MAYSMLVNTWKVLTTTGTTTAINTTGANLIVVAVVWSDGGGANPTPTMTDSKTNSWTPLTQKTASATAVRLFYCQGSPNVGTGHTFTLTAGAAFYGTIYIAAFSGSGPFDKQNGTISSVDTSVLSSGSITPAADNSLIISALGAHWWADNPQARAPLTQIHGEIGVGGVDTSSAFAYQIQTTAALINATYDWSNDAESAAVIAAFSPAGIGSIFNTTTSDSLSAVDTPTANIIAPKTAAETIAATDTPTGTTIASRTVGETIAATDTPAGTLTRSDAVTESGTASDVSTSTRAFSSSITETSTASDTPIATANLFDATTESGAASDTSTSTHTFSSSIAETITAIDTPIVIATLTGETTETGAAVDTATSTFITSVTASESSVLSDTASYSTALENVSSDSLAANDTPNAATLANGVILEAGSLSDSSSITYNTSSFRTEILNASDASDSDIDIVVAASDSLSLLDFVGTSFGTEVASSGDDLSLLDTVETLMIARIVSYDNTLSLIDTADQLLFIRVVSYDNTLTLIDTVETLLDAVDVNGDSLSLVEIIDAGTDTWVVSDDDLSIVDTVDTLTGALVDSDDTLSTLDSADRYAIFVATVDEVLSIMALSTSGFLIHCDASDLLAANDTIEQQATFKTTIIRETMTIVETVDERIPQTALYPIATVLPNQTGNIIQTDNGNLTVIPISITTSSLTSVVVTMASHAQDFSLRVWVSQERNGLPIGRTWNANRTPDKVCVLYTADMPPPENVIGVPVEIGSSYYINILNLTATDNAFKFDLAVA